MAVMALVMSCTKGKLIEKKVDETEGLLLVKKFSNTTHDILLYTQTGKLQQGFNKIFFHIKDKENNLMSNAIVSIKPMMNMTSMKHSCPYSLTGKKENTVSLYEGYIVFQMAGNDSEFWDLTFDYTINGKAYTVSSPIDVTAFQRRNIVSFKGSDNTSYIIALVEPNQPRVAINNMAALVYKKSDMMNYATADNYTIKIDPRMPSMGNHGTPNNKDLQQTGNDKMYRGNLSLTMTGLWRINLQLANQEGNILKGEPVTNSNESSSIYFEIEF